MHSKCPIIKYKGNDLVSHLLPAHFQEIDQVDPTAEIKLNPDVSRMIIDVFGNKLLNLERVLKLDLVNSLGAFVALIVN